MSSSPDVGAAVDAIRGWGERAAWTGWDPYDALTSPYARALTRDRPLGRRLLTQAVKRSPLNLRPLLRIPRARDAKGIALALSGYARLGDAAAARSASELADWLLAAARPGRSGIGWGYHFDVQTRFFYYRRDEPNAVATAFAAHALLDARDLLGLDVAAALRGVVAFLADDLLAPEGYFRYVDAREPLIHNANLLACSVLARAGGGPPIAGPVALTLAAQRGDGAWPYSDRPGGAWVDNFHTGYVLESLAACAPLVPDAVPALLRGIRYWERALFLADGTPRASSTSTLPLDAHAYAQAIETWLAVLPWRPDALERAERVAALLVGRMLAPDGHVYFERRRLWLNRTPFVRWTTAAAFRALARLLLAREVAHARVA